MSEQLTRRDLFRGMMVAATATTLAQLAPNESALVVRATAAELQAFGRITEPTPVTVGRVLKQYEPAEPGEMAFVQDRKGTFVPFGIISQMNVTQDVWDTTSFDSADMHYTRGLPKITYEVQATGITTVNLGAKR